MKGVSLAVLGLAAMLGVTPALAKDKDQHEDRGRGNPQEMHGNPRDTHGKPQAARGPEHRAPAHRFGDRDHDAVHAYYAKSMGRGHCPPGLAKKGNGCMPPGQARKWAVGRPLPRDVIFYSLPPALVVQLTPPPAGYRYVRVANDVLMIAAGTGMVIDAITDLGAR
jgi:Ni/Co efflux regulator RcnB